MKTMMILAIVAVACAACADSSTQPVYPDLEAAMASAPEWTAAEIARELPVDDATRADIEEKLEALRGSLLDLHRRHQAIATLEGDERDAYSAAIQSDAASLHEQHEALWADVDPAVTEALRAKLHERMQARHGSEEATLHERMRGLHGAGH